MANYQVMLSYYRPQEGQIAVCRPTFSSPEEALTDTLKKLRKVQPQLSDIGNDLEIWEVSEAVTSHENPLIKNSNFYGWTSKTMHAVAYGNEHVLRTLIKRISTYTRTEADV